MRHLDFISVLFGLIDMKFGGKRKENEAQKIRESYGVSQDCQEIQDEFK
jgi:hypothetical protein